jgi:hypothetical protein
VIDSETPAESEAVLREPLSPTAESVKELVSEIDLRNTDALTQVSTAAAFSERLLGSVTDLDAVSVAPAVSLISRVFGGLVTRAVSDIVLESVAVRVFIDTWTTLSVAAATSVADLETTIERATASFAVAVSRAALTVFL